MTMKAAGALRALLLPKRALRLGLYRKVRKVQCVCEGGGEAVPTTIVGVVELAIEGLEAKF